MKNVPNPEKKKKIEVVYSDLKIGESCIKTTLHRDLKKCLSKTKIEIDETVLDIYLIKLLQLGYLCIDEQMTQKYLLTHYKVNATWNTLTLVTK